LIAIESNEYERERAANFKVVFRQRTKPGRIGTGSLIFLVLDDDTKVKQGETSSLSETRPNLWQVMETEWKPKKSERFLGPSLTKSRPSWPTGLAVSQLPLAQTQLQPGQTVADSDGQ
jgi:hypothetical protein